MAQNVFWLCDLVVTDSKPFAMHRLLEILFGLQRGFLSRAGEYRVSFNPRWPAQEMIGAAGWNTLLILLALILVIYVYLRDTRVRSQRIVLGSLRMLSFLLLIALLNRPVLVLVQSHTEESVLPVLVDDSLSMRVPDGTADRATRLQAVVSLFDSHDQALLRDLAKVHTLKFFRFDSNASPMDSNQSVSAATQPTPDSPVAAISSELRDLKPTGTSTDLGSSLASVLDDLQGQRLAGIVLCTDGRQTPPAPLALTLASLKEAGVRVYPIAVGSDRRPINLELQGVTAEDSAFKGDIVDVKATVRATGLSAPQDVTVRLIDKRTGQPLTGLDGEAAQQHATVSDDQPTEIELPFKPDRVGQLDVQVSVDALPGETDADDNARTIQVTVLDAKITMLYVDGYPRWDYRYLKNEMIRDPSVQISCLLTSADPTFRQEGNKPITRFPETMDELMDYDVVVFGDVDPRQFSDSQLQLVSEFVSKKGGGFGMVAGPRFSPQDFRGTPIETLLPVNISQVITDESRPNITEGFRPILTKAGDNSSIFRFFADKKRNAQYLHDEMPLLYWYCRGVVAKPGASEVYAEHPTDEGPDNHRAPLLVMGRFGAGRTLFSAIDDSWRWRLYTGESVFDTYWLQQLRYLARGRKLGQRRFALAMSQPAYQLGASIRATLRVLDPQLLGQFPDQIQGSIIDEHGQPVRAALFQRQPGQDDLYTFAATADQLGSLNVELPPLPGSSTKLTVPFRVSVPDLEMSDASVDRSALEQLGKLNRNLDEESQRLGKPSAVVIAYDSAAAVLPHVIQSAAKVSLIETSEPLWTAPVAMVLFVVLITAEWLLRKRFGLI